MSAQIKNICLSLLKREFALVGKLRTQSPNDWAKVPDIIRKTANRWLGQGRQDAEGKAALRGYLDLHHPR